MKLYHTSGATVPRCHMTYAHDKYSNNTKQDQEFSKESQIMEVNKCEKSKK